MKIYKNNFEIHSWPSTCLKDFMKQNILDHCDVLKKKNY